MRRVLFALSMLLAATGAAAYEPLVEKQTFDMGAFTTRGGATIPEVKVGYETYGTLNEARDNAILVTHFFSGTSHAAGRYTEDGARGYWDKYIGAGKLIDTERYFVIASDTLININTGDPNVVTTGPASINPETGAPYGMDFPIVTLGDIIDVQKALVESLGIERLHSVIGASMGGMQALQWAADHPEMVGRAVPIIASGEADAFLIGWLNIWSAPIKLDAKWNGGDYYGAEPPVDGLAEALKLVTLQARHWEWAEAGYGRQWAVEAADPAESFEHTYAIEAFLDQAARGRAAIADANHFLYLAKANQLYAAGDGGTLEERLAAIEVPVLLLPAADDLIFFPELVAKTRDAIAADGTAVDYAVLEGNLGHLDGVVSLEQVEERIRAFLTDAASE